MPSHEEWAFKKKGMLGFPSAMVKTTLKGQYIEVLQWTPTSWKMDLG